jgi:hypothetical protein
MSHFSLAPPNIRQAHSGVLHSAIKPLQEVPYGFAKIAELHITALLYASERTGKINIDHFARNL